MTIRRFNFLPTVTVEVDLDEGVTKVDFSWDGTLQGELDEDGNFIENAAADAVGNWLDKKRGGGYVPDALVFANVPVLPSEDEVDPVVDIANVLAEYHQDPHRDPVAAVRRISEIIDAWSPEDTA